MHSILLVIISYEHPSLELGILFSHSYPPLNNWGERERAPSCGTRCQDRYM